MSSGGMVASAAAGASEENGVKFSKYLDGFKVYIIEDTDASGDNLITNVVDKEYNFNFTSGDRLHLLIEYKPFQSSFSSMSSNSFGEIFCIPFRHAATASTTSQAPSLRADPC